MKNSLKLKSLFTLVATALITLSCNLDDGTDTIPIPESNLIDLISDDSNLSSLVAALRRADLETTLQENGPFTVLAPDNAAFTSFLGAAGFTNVNEVPVETLKQLLLNHVIKGRIDSAILANLQRNYLENLADGPTASTFLSLYFDAVDGITFNGTATVTSGDRPAANGIYHIIDAVIGLPTLSTFVGIDENFKSFDTALDLISPVSNVPNSLEEGNGPWTVFIPVEQAFDDLIDSNTEWNFLSDINEDLLTDVISHHILEGNIRSTDITGNQMVVSLEGDPLTFTITNGDIEITDGSGNEGALLAVTDIQAANGIIHVLSNKVLIPNTTN
jgi:uncharacterized surface protein with fasciclin (FAS1) repeats